MVNVTEKDSGEVMSIFDRLISGVFLLAWVVIFYGILYLFHRFIPLGFIVAQILFILSWGLLPHYGVYYLGYLPYDNIAIFWFASSIVFLYLLINKKSRF